MPQTHAMPMHACRAEGNPLALAAFICSLIGFFSGGILSPIGVILALFAMGKHPRGFAIAALILGLMGSACISGLVLAGVLGAVLAAVGIVGSAAAVHAALEPKFDASADLAQLNTAILSYYDDKRALPEHLGLLVPEYYQPAADPDSGPEREPLTDPWSKPYHYELAPDRGGFTLHSDGPDAAPGTADDLSLTTRVDSLYAPEPAHAPTRAPAPARPRTRAF